MSEVSTILGSSFSLSGQSFCLAVKRTEGEKISFHVKDFKTSDRASFEELKRWVKQAFEELNDEQKLNIISYHRDPGFAKSLRPTSISSDNWKVESVEASSDLLLGFVGAAINDESVIASEFVKQQLIQGLDKYNLEKSSKFDISSGCEALSFCIGQSIYKNECQRIQPPDWY